MMSKMMYKNFLKKEKEIDELGDFSLKLLVLTCKSLKICLTKRKHPGLSSDSDFTFRE